MGTFRTSRKWLSERERKKNRGCHRLKCFRAKMTRSLFCFALFCSARHQETKGHEPQTKKKSETQHTFSEFSSNLSFRNWPNWASELLSSRLIPESRNDAMFFNRPRIADLYDALGNCGRHRRKLSCEKVKPSRNHAPVKCASKCRLFKVCRGWNRRDFFRVNSAGEEEEEAIAEVLVSERKKVGWRVKLEPEAKHCPREMD